MKLTKSRHYELLYCAMWFIYSFSNIINQSLLEIGKIYKLELFFLIGVLSFFYFCHEKVSYKKIIYSVLILVCCVLIAKNIDSKFILIYVVFIANSDFTDFRKLLKISFLSVSCATLSVLLLCKLSVIPDYIFVRENGAQAHCFGFSYYYHLSAIVMFLSIMYIYLRKDVKLLELGIIAGISYYIYTKCTTRLPFYVLLFSIGLYLIVYKMNILADLNRKKLRIYSLCAFPLVCIICGIGAYNYDNTNKYYIMLDKLLNNRISLSYKGFQLYNIKLLGQHVEMKGNTYKEVNTNYFFIDSGYILSILEYGIIATAILVAVYSLLYYYSVKTNDKKLFIWITMILVFNIVNGCWFALVSNPVILLLLQIKKQPEVLFPEYKRAQYKKVKLKI